MKELLDIAPFAVGLLPVVGLTKLFIEGARDIRVQTQSKQPIPNSPDATKYPNRSTGGTIVEIPTGAKAVVWIRNRFRKQAMINVHDIRVPQDPASEPFTYIRINRDPKGIKVVDGERRPIDLYIEELALTAERPRPQNDRDHRGGKRPTQGFRNSR